MGAAVSRIGCSDSSETVTVGGVVDKGSTTIVLVVVTAGWPVPGSLVPDWAASESAVASLTPSKATRPNMAAVLSPVAAIRAPSAG